MAKKVSSGHDLQVCFETVKKKKKTLFYLHTISVRYVPNRALGQIEVVDHFEATIIYPICSYSLCGVVCERSTDTQTHTESREQRDVWG